MFAAQPATRQVLTLEIAKQVAAACRRRGGRQQVDGRDRILDEGGNLMYLERADDTQIAKHPGRSGQSSERRRIQAAYEGVRGCRRRRTYGDRQTAGAMPIEGGIPLMLNGRVAGAIGVSGSYSQQDGQIAKAGADALAEIVAK